MALIVTLFVEMLGMRNMEGSFNYQSYGKVYLDILKVRTISCMISKSCKASPTERTGKLLRTSSIVKMSEHLLTTSLYQLFRETMT